MRRHAHRGLHCWMPAIYYLPLRETQAKALNTAAATVFPMFSGVVLRVAGGGTARPMVGVMPRARFPGAMYTKHAHGVAPLLRVTDDMWRDAYQTAGVLAATRTETRAGIGVATHTR